MEIQRISIVHPAKDVVELQKDIETLVKQQLQTYGSKNISKVIIEIHTGETEITIENSKEVK